MLTVRLKLLGGKMITRKQAMRKMVTLSGHDFDCLPGHVTISGTGKGATVRVAAMRAIESMLDSQQLRKKRIGEFKISATVITTAF